jgi:hypothetical protein
VKRSMASATTLDRVLSGLAREGELFDRLPGGRVRCHARGHRCLIPPGQRGVCKVRWNEDGDLMVPGGCDYHCAHCQNALRTRIAGIWT